MFICKHDNKIKHIFQSVSEFAPPAKIQMRDGKHHASAYLVHLTIGSIANHLHQLKDTCWILEKKK